MVHGECGGGAFTYGTPVIATVDGVQRHNVVLEMLKCL